MTRLLTSAGLLGTRAARLSGVAVLALLTMASATAAPWAMAAPAAPAPATAAPVSLFPTVVILWSATFTVESVVPVPPVATSLASIGARLGVLREAETALESNALMRLLAQDRVNGAFRRMALVAAAYPVHTELRHEGSRLVGVATIRKSPQKVEALLREALRKSDNLDMWAEVLARYSTLLDEGMALLARERRELAEAAAAKDLAVTQNRLDGVARKVEALDLYSAQLRSYDEGWPDPQGVLTSMDKALELDPDNVIFEVARAEALTRLDRVYEALDALNEAAKHPDFPSRGHAARGIAQLRLHMPSLAVHDFSRALAERSDKAAWWHARGAAKLLAGELDTLCDDLEKACALGDCQGLANVRTRKLCR